MKQYILSHDIGTSGDKAALFTVDGEFVKAVVAPYDTDRPEFGWAEQDSEDWWKAVCVSTRELTEGIDKSLIAGIACTGTMNGCLCLDRDGKPLMKSIIWQDGRAGEECDELKERMGMHEIKNISGIPLSPNFSVSKMMWVKKHRPDIYEKTEHCIQPKDYISYRMTGRFVTDPSDACMYQCYDVRNGRWSEKILETAGIRKNILPEVIGSADVAGYLTKNAAEQTGLLEGIPVVAGAGDGTASSLGLGLFDKGTEMISIGSSGGASMVIGELTCELEYGYPIGKHVSDGLYVVGGAIQSAGASLEWAKKTIAPDIEDYSGIYKLASEAPPGSNGVMFLPYLQGERTPFWNVNAKGSFLNLSSVNTRADMMRSVMEGVAMHLGYVHRELQKYEKTKLVLVNGRGTQSELWCGIISDVLGMEVRRYPEAGMETSLGAAMLASYGLGFVKEYRDFTDKLGECSVIQPDMENHRLYQEMLDYFIGLYRATEPFYNQIKNKFLLRGEG
ncbi:MAG: FGGY-family carbohydrate kinase [Lachnospiraceae bacterium]|nr:FGGY-family carbohydrate kinase [Lachnospiraceae bacterium]